MKWERDNRSPERQIAVKMGHAARVVSDVCSFGQLRLHALLRICNGSTDVLEVIDKRYETLFSELQIANEKFNLIEYELEANL